MQLVYATNYETSVLQFPKICKKKKNIAHPKKLQNINK